MPKEVGYGSFFYHHAQHGNAIAAIGAYGQMCYANPKHEAVVAFYSTTAPWAGAVAAGKKFQDIFEHDCLLERERWHMCHEVSRLVGS